MQLHPRRSLLAAICHRNSSTMCCCVIIDIQGRLTSNAPAMAVIRLLTMGFSVSTKYNFLLSCDVQCFPERQAHRSHARNKSLTHN